MGVHAAHYCSGGGGASRGCSWQQTGPNPGSCLSGFVIIDSRCLHWLALPCAAACFSTLQVLEAACGVWHTAAIVAEPEGSPYSMQHSPLKTESSAAADLLAGTAGGGSFAELAGPPASPAHGPSHSRNNSTSSAFSEVRRGYAVVLVMAWCGLLFFFVCCFWWQQPFVALCICLLQMLFWRHSQAAVPPASACLLAL